MEYGSSLPADEVHDVRLAPRAADRTSELIFGRLRWRRRWRRVFTFHGAGEETAGDGVAGRRQGQELHSTTLSTYSSQRADARERRRNRTQAARLQQIRRSGGASDERDRAGGGQGSTVAASVSWRTAPK
jgi:hypothetical protein